MKAKILIITAMLLIPASAWCFNSSKIYEQEQAQRKIAEEKAAIVAAEERKQADAEREKYYQSNGRGFVLSVEEINAREKSIYEIKPVKIWTSRMDSCGGASGITAQKCTGELNGVLSIYPGSTHSFNTASAHIINGNEIIDFAFGKLLSYEVHRPDGITEKLTWNDKTNIVTVKLSDGTSMVIAKINMMEPAKTRIADANLPMNAQSTLVQIFNKRGVSLSEKIMLTMIEDWYKKELNPAGTTLQTAMTGLISEVDVRDQFLQYCQKVAIPTKKETVPVSTKVY